MKIVIATKLSIENTPPLETVAIVMSQLGNDVYLANYCSSSKTRQRLSFFGVKVVSFCEDKWPSKVFSKVIKALRFRKFLNKFMSSKNIDLLWLCNPDIVPLIASNNLKSNIIIQSLELYDKVPKYLKYIKQVEDIGGKIVVPDQTRSYILKAMLNLKNLPGIIHNKPFHHPITKFINGEYTELLPPDILSKKKKLVLYQGHITRDRPILEVAKVIREFEDLVFVAMGGCVEKEYINELRALGGVHIDHIDAPFHLNITSWASIGFMSYDHKSLNTLFCAPNKVFEYSGFGIPFISSYHPNLNYYASGFSSACQVFDDSKIRLALHEILSNYEAYSKNATDFYNSVSIENEISNILESVTTNNK